MTGLSRAQASPIAGVVVAISAIALSAVFASRKAQNPSGFATSAGSDVTDLSAGLQQPSEKNRVRQIMS
jgi:hypothetical protein